MRLTVDVGGPAYLLFRFCRMVAFHISRPGHSHPPIWAVVVFFWFTILYAERKLAPSHIIRHFGDEPLVPDSGCQYDICNPIS